MLLGSGKKSTLVRCIPKMFLTERFIKLYFFFRRMEVRGKSLESLKHEDKIKTCPDCGSKQIGFDKGEIFCKKCGLVID